MGRLPRMPVSDICFFHGRISCRLPSTGEYLVDEPYLMLFLGAFGFALVLFVVRAPCTHCECCSVTRARRS